jgi:phosphoribosyl 1,2-cyclic phosphate phosphodiesterase
MIEGTFLFLGTGASMGVPIVGCKCSVCSSTSKYNKRFRPSALIKLNKKNFLIDVSPDFRSQALINKIENIDALIFTHLHYDHSAGIDDLRPIYFERNKAIDCLLSPETLNEMEKRFYYFFEPISSVSTFSNIFKFHLLEEDVGNTDFLGIPINNFSYFQMGMKVSGYRFGDLAYVTDIREYDDNIFSSLKGVKKLVISALRSQSSQAHFSISESINFAQKVNAEKTYFTHIAHDVDHNEENKQLPKGIELAYDGLEINFYV